MDRDDLIGNWLTGDNEISVVQLFSPKNLHDNLGRFYTQAVDEMLKQFANNMLECDFKLDKLHIQEEMESYCNTAGIGVFGEYTPTTSGASHIWRMNNRIDSLKNQLSTECNAKRALLNTGLWTRIKWILTGVQL